MSELEVFNSEKFGKVRTIVLRSEPWFVGKDVATCLGYTDISHTIIDHVDGEDRMNSKSQGQIDPEFGQHGQKRPGSVRRCKESKGDVVQ